MALIYHATLTPTKLELLASWLPSRSWFTGDTDLESVGSYRFDDPDDVVGIETLLVRAGDGPVLQVPLTYRGTPLAGADSHLVGTTEHSVLGGRWVYDGCADPVWATAFATAVLAGGTQAEQFVDVGGRLEPRQPTATVTGSGTAGTPVPAIDAVSCRDEGPTTLVRAGEVELLVARVVGTDVQAAQTLTGSWAQGGPVVLAGVRPA
jgi:maltokinase-like protein